MISFLEKHRKKCIVLLWLGAILASAKSILTDTGFDNAYTVAMSFRHLRGDGMFEQMWEPHQTSIFLRIFYVDLSFFCSILCRCNDISADCGNSLFYYHRLFSV